MKNKYYIFFKLSCLLWILIVAGALGIAAQPLEKIKPAVKVFQKTDWQVFYGSDVPAPVVKLFASIPPENFKSDSFPTIYKAPASRNLYLAIAIRNNDTESEIILFSHENGDLKEIGRSAVIENAVTYLTFFTGKNTSLILADVAVPPDFTGLQAFELKNRRLTNLGNLSVAHQNKPSGLHDDFISPAGNAAAELKNGVYYLTFRGKLYSDWGAGPASELRIGSAATFYYSKSQKSFKIKSKRRG